MAMETLVAADGNDPEKKKKKKNTYSNNRWTCWRAYRNFVLSYREHIIFLLKEDSFFLLQFSKNVLAVCDRECVTSDIQHTTEIGELSVPTVC